MSEEERDEQQGLLQQPVATPGEAGMQELDDEDGDWRSKIRLLVISFAGSALYVGIWCQVCQYMTNEDRLWHLILFLKSTISPS